MKSTMEVKVWNDIVVIPTYEVSKPEQYPMFFEKRVYQGSSGSVYPHPVIEKISDEKIDKKWNVVFMENQFLKIMILPELGGRIQMAYDKVKKRHFVYYNEVIKPALVGLTGPWISGGIEFNWPQHHRPSTYDPVDFHIDYNEDGSVTVWVSEIERMFRTKGMAGFTLHPDKAYIEIKGRLYNRTPHPQTFLWWANPAVAVNDQYQSVFPEDVNAVFDHGKRDVSEFPIAKGVYYKVDYSEGVDISRYKNIPVPTSYMAVNSEYDFVGGYENDTEAGLLHVANHHISPGKKQWTWGNGDFGQAWDRNLTDKNGPYIELMCGVFTDNQPDFAWIQPYEEKSFTQYFMPYQKVGLVKNATKDAILNVEFNNGQVRLVVYATGIFSDSSVELDINEERIIKKVCDLSPESIFDLTLPYEGIPDTIKAVVKSNEGNVLVSWNTSKRVEKQLPEPAKPAKLPEEIRSIEELYLTGLHIEQYRHATYRPIDYYSEALKREPSDVRCNNAIGLYYLKSGDFNKALGHFQKAINTLTQFNPNPVNGEALFNKGLTLKYLERYDEAYDAFYKSCWNAEFKSSGFFNLALIETRRGNFTRALELLEESLIHNYHNHKGRHLKVILLRNLKDPACANYLEESLELDSFNFGLLFEKYLVTSDPQVKIDLQFLLRNYVHNYLEIAFDYADAGLYSEAIDFLSIYLQKSENIYPIAYYTLGYFYYKIGDLTRTKEFYFLGSNASSDYCFPNRLEEVIILNNVILINPEDSKALYYLGNFWMSNRNYDQAKICWEKSLKLMDSFPLVLRNLSLLYFNKFENKEKALECLEQAFEIDPSNSRLLMELDQLYKKINKSNSFRLQFLELHLTVVQDRDDLYLEYITLLNLHGQYEKALLCISNRIFHPWEGGEGKVPSQYSLALTELAKQNFQNGNHQKALELLKAALQYPENLGEGKLESSIDNDIYYWLGCVYQALNRGSEAVNNFKKATLGASEPQLAMYYNDQSPDKILYQGLAFLKLGDHINAELRFMKLISYGEKHFNDQVKLDYFAVSLPDLQIWEEDLNTRNQIHCDYMLALGNIGFGNGKKANQYLNKILERDESHLGAYVHKSSLMILLPSLPV
ncbi:DUF5107 domain-containing protein [Belliella sp. R4-6]|uniref:DUF5107 domain-containing protein n=1 Tax=Belliella alkalica TaxID=1730871 RepID=A0ABS9VD42_9BACT|nr:DUF5107 domain-containing protein [Belliella alkalica]MCH7414359.1 DUF5107 domain-containing protein [Belliella alkalica]